MDIINPLCGQKLEYLDTPLIVHVVIECPPIMKCQFLTETSLFERNYLNLLTVSKKQINILICLLKKNVIAVSDCKNPKVELKTSAEQ